MPRDNNYKCCMLVAKVLALWPHAGELWKGAEKEEREQKGREEKVGGGEVGEGHSWKWTGAIFRCSDCMRQSPRPYTVKENCSGLPPTLQKAVEADRGHHLWWSTTPCGLWHAQCARCGGWMEQRALLLLDDMRWADVRVDVT